MPPAPPGQAAHGAEARPTTEPGWGSDAPYATTAASRAHRRPSPAPAWSTGASVARRGDARHSRRARPRTADRAAPTSGPRSPRPPGTTRAPGRTRAGSAGPSRPGLQRRTGRRNPARPSRSTTARGRSSRFTTDGDGPADQRPGTLDDVRGRQPGRLPGRCRDRRPGRLRLEAAAAAAAAPPTVGYDDDVTDVAGVSEPAVEQSPVEHDPAPDAGRHHHRQVVTSARRRTDPSLPERQRLGVVVDEGRQPGQLGQPRRERKGPPRLDVERRHLVAARAHRPAAPDAADDEAVAAGVRRSTPLDHSARSAQRSSAASRAGLAAPSPPRVGRSGRLHRPSHQGTVRGDQPGRDLGAADVDGQARSATGRCSYLGHGHRRCDADGVTRLSGAARSPRACSVLAPVEAGAEPVAGLVHRALDPGRAAARLRSPFFVRVRSCQPARPMRRRLRSNHTAEANMMTTPRKPAMTDLL